MRFFFFGRRDRAPKNVVHQIPLKAFIRQMVYDSLLDEPERIAAQMGLPPISDDVQEMEHEASEARLTEIQALIPLLDAHSDVAAQMCKAAFKMHKAGEDLSESELASYQALFKLVSFASTLSAVSTLVEIGALQNMAVSDDK